MAVFEARELIHAGRQVQPFSAAGGPRDGPRRTQNGRLGGEVAGEVTQNTSDLKI
jgi:hypothetical protein